jgi:outer membrane protein
VAPTSLFAFILLAAASACALAQSPTIELLDPSQRADGVIEKDVREPAPRLRAALGAGISIAPRFEGSDRSRTRVVPIVQLAYGPVFFGLGGLGLNLYRDSHWRLGANLSLSGRKESADPRLQGLGDVDRTVLAGVFGVYANRGILARAHIATDIGGKGQGTVVRLDAFGRLAGGERLAFFAGPGLTWSDRRRMQTFFGVTADQSARSGLPEFDASAGVDSVRLSTGAAYRIDARWRLVGIYSLARLQGDAAASPITEERTQNSLLASAIYLFR